MVSRAEFLEPLAGAAFTTDAEGRINFYNQAAAELWGHHPELGSQWCGSWRLYYPDGRILPHDQCPMALTLKQGRPVRGEAIVERPDGTRVPVLAIPALLRDAAGRITGAINSLVDLTDRHLVEEESARMAAIVSSSGDAMISKTLDGRITSWNAGATRIFGFEASEMIGQIITRIIPPDLYDEEKRILAQLTRGERIEHYETVRIANDGRRIDVSLSVSPLRDVTGRVVGASKVARDISERKRAEEVQRLLLDELHHRIKNTLATVQAIASQTLRRATTPAEFVSSFNGRIHALARAHALLTNSTFQGGEVLDLVRDQLLLGGADDHRISCSGPSIMLDAQAALHLALVLHELGTNARKHGALSAPTGAVSVSWEMRANGERTLLLNWQESGGPKVSAPSALGFGTILIEQSLKAHNGEASLRYAESGLCCVITLPLPELKRPIISAPARPGRIPVVVPQPEPDQARLAGKRILVVEDEALIAMVLVDYLTEAGCEVVGPAHSLEKAKALICETEIDAALLDANLAGRPVDELALALTRRNTPFAFVTGNGRGALPRTFQEAVIVEKPFTQDQVLAALERLLCQGSQLAPLQPTAT